MQVTVTGAEEVLKSLDLGTTYLTNDFWKRVKDDVFKNLKESTSVHNDTGTLNRNVYSNVTGDGVEAGILDNGMMVDWNGKRVNYGIFANFGSKPHKIKPKNKKSLRFISGGKFAFTKEVNHPGYIGSQFIDKAAKKTFNNLDKIFKETK